MQDAHASGRVCVASFERISRPPSISILVATVTDQGSASTVIGFPNRFDDSGSIPSQHGRN
jgi:hypothetical protein